MQRPSSWHNKMVPLPPDFKSHLGTSFARCEKAQGVGSPSLYNKPYPNYFNKLSIYHTKKTNN